MLIDILLFVTVILVFYEFITAAFSLFSATLKLNKGQTPLFLLFK